MSALAFVRRQWLVCLLALVVGVLVIALLAPAGLGGLVGRLWVTTMAVLVRLLEGFFAH